MGTIQTTRGEVEETLLDKFVYPVDDAKHWGSVVEYCFKDDGSSAAKFLSGFAKVNPFEADPPGGVIDIEEDGQRAVASVTAFEKNLVVVDNDHEFSCAVEYRRPGSTVIVHRSADVKLKRPTAEGVSAMGNVR